jgi:hypothetical protein
MSKVTLGLLSILALAAAVPAFADEVSTTRSKTVQTPMGSASATQSSKTSTDGIGAKTENSSTTEQISPSGGYRSTSTKETQATDGLGTTEKSSSVKSTVSP